LEIAYSNDLLLLTSNNLKFYVIFYTKGLKILKVGIALSGGVDSAVALYRLIKEGHEVKAYHMKTLKDDFFVKKSIKKKICCSPSDTIDAIKIAKKFGVELKIVDLSDPFRKLVIERFKDDLLKGLTPNPCVHCNRLIKFGILMDQAIQDGMEYFSSGHFANIVYSDKYKKNMIAKAKDHKKDQSYFLALLNPEKIDKLMFPNGKSTKEENRKLAKEITLHVSEKPESQDVCFIPDGKIESFLLDEGIDERKGLIVDEDGKILGNHRGYFLYTIGQRKGLRISLGKKMYVKKTIARTNLVVVSPLEKVFFKGLVAVDPVWHAELPDEFEATCKVRKKAQEVRCFVKRRGNEVIVEFEKEVFAVTPGQIAVFYDSDILLGGAIIKEGIE